MNAHFETGSNYPLSSEPTEGYGADPLTRTGKVILTNALNGKHIRVTEDGCEHVADRKDATQFNDHSEAAVKAGQLVTEAKARQQEKLAA